MIAFQVRAIAAFAMALFLSSTAIAGDSQTTDTTYQASAGTTDIPDFSILLCDVPGLLDRASNFATAVTPDKVSTAPTIRELYAAALGDPQLKGIPPGSNALILVAPDGVSGTYVEIRESHANLYIQKTEASGKLAKFKDGLLVAGRTKDELEKDMAMIESARTLLARKNGVPAIILTFNIESLLSRYSTQIETFLKLLPDAQLKSQTAGLTTATEQGRGILRVLRRRAEITVQADAEILKRARILEGIFWFPPDGVRLDINIVPLSPIHETRNTSHSAALLEILPASGAIRATSDFSPEALLAFSRGVAADTAADLHTTTGQQEAWRKICSDVLESCDGSAALVALSPQFPGFNASIAFGVRDPQAALAAIEKLPHYIRYAGIPSLYVSSGARLSIGFDRNIRSYRGINIHRFIHRLNVSDIEQLKLASMGLTDSSAEIAFVHKTLLVAMGSASIEKLIDAALQSESKTPQALQKPETAALAAARLGPGGKFYMDYNLVKAFATVGQILPPRESNQFARFARAENTSTSLTIAGYVRQGKYTVSALLPTDLILAIKDAVSTATSARIGLLPQTRAPAAKSSSAKRARH
jgi:hypothetical protein